jgi:Uma2 family endonuclease
MTTPIIAEKRYTAEEFWEFAELPENEHKRLELDDGEIIEMPESRPINTITAGRIIHFLNAYVIPRDTGYVTVPDGGYKLAPSKVRQPDVGFISKARVSKIPARFEIAPDFAVEVVSENEDVLKKVNEYLNAGTQLVWAVYPNEKEVYVFKRGDVKRLDGRIYYVGDTLDGGEVLPDFKLPVKDIFPE